MRRARPSHILLVSARALAIYPAPANFIGRAIKMNHPSRCAQIHENNRASCPHSIFVSLNFISFLNFVSLNFVSFLNFVSLFLSPGKETKL